MCTVQHAVYVIICIFFGLILAPLFSLSIYRHPIVTPRSIDTVSKEDARIRPKKRECHDLLLYTEIGKSGTIRLNRL